ncbi:MAG TPA: hypothetical protein VFK05_30800 [Polyangiaceae bacterium]|nr:hypothetical protein [Polyangiaceae bacterium]
MRRVRYLGCLALSLGLLGGPSAGVAQPAQQANKGSQAAETAPVTPPPKATPQVSWRIDVARLAQDMVRGTNVSFDSLDVVANTVNPNLRADIPLSAATSLDQSRSVVAFRPANASGLKRGPAAPELNARGWFPIEETGCVVTAASNRPSLAICGSGESIFAYGDAIDASYGPLPGNDVFEIELNPLTTWRTSLDGLRGSVVQRVDGLLRPPALANNAALRFGLFDLGYAVAARISEAALDLPRIRVGFSFDAQGAHYRAPLRLRSGSPLERALQGAHEKRAPQAFWQLSDSLESAWFGSSNLLVSLVTPEPRALKLLAAARDSQANVRDPSATDKWLDAMQSLTACLAPDRTLIQASGSLQASKRVALKSEQPKAVFVPTPTVKPEQFWTIALEDPESSCANGLRALAKLYAGLAGEKSTDSEFELLKPGKGVPAAALVARIGTAKAQHYAALTTRAGFSWLSTADTLPALSAALDALAAPPAHRLSAAPELADLAKTAVLFGGYASDVDLLGVVNESAAEKPQRAPWSLRQDGSAWAFSGSIDAGYARRVATQFMLNLWNVRDWSKFSDTQRSAFARFLDSMCRLGNAGACNTLGIRYADGEGLNKDVDRAHELLTLGCAAGEGVACINSAFYGASQAEKLTAARRGCELKSPLSCAWYGTWLLESHTLEDHPKGIKNLEFSCDSSNGLGCWRLADAYEEGAGVGKDEEKSRELYTRSCNLSFAGGCIALGNLLAREGSEAASLKLALKAFEVGCKLDTQNGCYALGFAYARGFSGEKDMKAARTHWAQACDAGHAEACRMLADTTEGQ